jgi:AcrR family transcriptional regulator
VKRARRTQTERSDEMRARLAQAAYEVIALRGHSAFRTAAVAAAAGVSQGALLHHFPTKDAVTLAAVSHALSLGAAASQERLRHVRGTADTVLRAMLADFRAFFLEDGFWVALDITMDASKTTIVFDEIRHIVAKYRAPVYDQWAEKLRACGWPATRATTAVRTTSALVSGFAIRSLWADDAALSRATEERWIELIFNQDL